MKTESERGIQSPGCLETDSQSMAGEAFHSDSSQGGADHTWGLFLSDRDQSGCLEGVGTYLDSAATACLATTARTTCVYHCSYPRQEGRCISEF